MNWEDEGFLISKRKFRENANIIDVFTTRYGKVSGIVYGGNSRKIRNYLQISNKIYLTYTSKSENRIGYFKTELIEAISPKYFNHKKKTATLLSLTSVLNLLLPESQANIKIYNSIIELIKNFDNDNWMLLYIFWELLIIRELGFDPDFNKFKSNINDLDKIYDLEIDRIKYKVPGFLIKNKIPNNINDDLIRKSLIFNRSIMSNKFFLPNNLTFPKSRILLENYFI
jgi:DNA repair protein RecO (recombination protein O)|tara:strand:- start:919 stop:1599 length:681 start_codon:yes stop_codon:yes gene_type:complete